MELVEVVLQGVVGVPALTRWSFPAGVAVVPAGSPEALVVRAAYELLGAQSDGKLSSAGLEGQPSRAAPSPSRALLRRMGLISPLTPTLSLASTRASPAIVGAPRSLPSRVLGLASPPPASSRWR